MKKLIVLFLVLTMAVSLLAACGKQGDSAQHGNYTDEMKIAYSCDLSPEDGADSVEREGDHQDSPYFSTLDFYNM